MAHKLYSITICDLLDNLIGETEPEADSAKNDEIEKNLMDLIDVLYWCLDGIYYAAKHTHSVHDSERRVGNRAYAVLDKIEKWCHKRMEELA